MDADAVTSLAKATLEGSLPFPQIVGELITHGVEYYHVDYASKSFTFYSAAGAAITAALPFEGLPSISKDWNGNERSEERRVGKECVGTCRHRGVPYLKKKKKT